MCNTSSLSLTERCQEDAREIREATIWYGAQQRGEAYKPDTDVLKAFQDLARLDVGILCTARSISCISHFWAPENIEW